MQKFFLSAALLLGLISVRPGTADETLSEAANETPLIGIVNFATCLTDSKAGKKEQENFEKMRKAMMDRMEDAKKELSEMATRFDDPEYLDSLSPKAEEELKAKYQTLQEDFIRYREQFYQMMNQMQMAMYQKMNGTIAKAARKMAEEHHLDYVMNKDVCFYIRPDLEMTTEVIAQMDKNFELEEKAEKLTENSEVEKITESSEVEKVTENSDIIEAVDEMTLDKAG